MRHHYWEAPIVIYLFLGGLGGGIFFLSAIFDLFVAPGSGQLFFAPTFFALAALAVGCFFLVFELGQPLVFWRVFTTKTAIIKWGAVLLSICLICGFIWWLSYLYLLGWGEWTVALAGALAYSRPLFLFFAGLAGFGIMVYTGVMLSTLKAHAFWATPALPVLFTISAMSTACAAIALSIGAFVTIPEVLLVGAVIYETVHLIDIILIIAELVVLLIMVLSFFGAGNVTAHQVATRWVKGKTAPLFWIGMVFMGLFVPLCFYLVGGHGWGPSVLAPVLVLCGGLLLRYLCVYSDERAPIPGEERFYTRLPKRDAAFIEKWKDGEPLF